MSQIPSSEPQNSNRRWDIFCAVVDNFGDIGTCWRLGRQLAEQHNAEVRLWVDDLTSFAQMNPHVSPGNNVQRIGKLEVRRWGTDFSQVDPADIVVEAFACELPCEYIQKMALMAQSPVWINLEYLSAEPWVEECHGLSSPHPTLPLTKYFFFPGFTERTGGLIREPTLLADRDAFDAARRSQFLQRIIGSGPNPVDVQNATTEAPFRISLFAYQNSALTPFLDRLAECSTPTTVFVCSGAAANQVGHWLGQAPMLQRAVQRGSLTFHFLPFLMQDDYDRLLWSCDLNFVRGEESFVRAQWAGRPFVWQIYPQADDVHLTKLNAFLERYLAGFEQAEPVRRFWLAWNGREDVAAAWPDFERCQKSLFLHGKVWADHLDRIGNLADNLERFVRGK